MGCQGLARSRSPGLGGGASPADSGLNAAERSKDQYRLDAFLDPAGGLLDVVDVIRLGADAQIVADLLVRADVRRPAIPSDAIVLLVVVGVAAEIDLQVLADRQAGLQDQAIGDEAVRRPVVFDIVVPQESFGVGAQSSASQGNRA